MQTLLLGVGAMIVFICLFVYLIKAEDSLPPYNRKRVFKQKPKKESSVK
jgi:hypothetical protein